MAEVDSVFDFLHNEIVNYTHRERQGKFIENDAVQTLDRMGFNVGQKLVERHCNDIDDNVFLRACQFASSGPGCSKADELNPGLVFTKDSPRFKDELDIMKFVCKDFWTALFKKQIDNLRTNHQGVYVLQDNKFRLLTQISNGKQYTESAPKYLAFSCGMIRGGLANLGVPCSVTADILPLPACRFQIVIQKT